MGELFLCRLCATKKKSFKNVMIDHNFINIVKILFGIRLIKQEARGILICLKCHMLTHEFYIFQQFVIERQQVHEQNKETGVPILAVDQLKIEECTSNDDDIIIVKDENVDSVYSCGDESSDSDFEIENFDPTNNAETGLYPTMFENGKMILSRQEMNKILKQFYKLECEVCQRSFSTIFELLIHYKYGHVQKGYVSCCGRKITSRKKMIEHIGRHIQPSAFECPVCQKTFARAHSLPDHLKTHNMPNENIQHVCNNCNESFDNNDQLESHKLTHATSESLVLLPCKFCEMAFDSPSSLQAHVSMMHVSLDHLCSECGKSFSSAGVLKNHMLCHDSDAASRVKCEVCDIVCKNAISLKQHMMKHSDFYIKCDLCEFKTHKGKYLFNHIRSKHSNEKHFECSHCQKKFKFKYNLNTHLVQHTEGKKYSCKYCKKIFPSSEIKNHVRTIHSTEPKNDEIKEEVLFIQID